jgi:hypothetical protein
LKNAYNQITETDIIFNANLYWHVYSGKMNWYMNGRRIFDFRRVALHELGHALGLGDQYTNNYKGTSVMYGIADDDQPESPQTDDINGIRAIYGGGGANSADVAAFVTRFYQQCLNRHPDTQGLINWTNHLLAGTLSGADVAYEFIFSEEFTLRQTQNEEFLYILYRTFFNREPDLAGFSGWLNLLNTAPIGDRTTREQVLNGFLYSLEFDILCAGYGINST